MCRAMQPLKILVLLLACFIAGIIASDFVVLFHADRTNDTLSNSATADALPLQ